MNPGDFRAIDHGDRLAVALGNQHAQVAGSGGVAFGVGIGIGRQLDIQQVAAFEELVHFRRAVHQRIRRLHFITYQ